MEHLVAVLLLLLRLLTLIAALAKNSDPPRYDTAYACEGKILKIECRDGELINLIRANYGRFSITICNDHGNTDWSVNCMSSRTLRVLNSRCTLQQNCSIAADTNLFGDPCVGTKKYLEAHYRCDPATTTTTTTRPSPPWLIASQPSVWSTAKPPTFRPPSHTHARGSNPPESSERVTTTTDRTVATASKSAVPREPPPTIRPPAPPPPAQPDTEKELPHEAKTTSSSSPPPAPAWKTSLKPASVPGYVPDYTDYIPSTTVSWAPDGDTNQYCAPVNARNMYWNWTRLEEVNVQQCPGGAAGLARWRCVYNPLTNNNTWHGISPDLSECKSVWLTSLDTRTQQGEDSISSIANELSRVTSSKTLYGGDMMTTTTIVNKMTERMSKNIQTFPDPQQREAIVTELLQSVVTTTSNLLDVSQQASWKDLTHKEQMNVATLLLIGLEENAFLLADTVVREKTVVQTAKNILLSVRVVETQNVQAIEHFPGVQSQKEWFEYSDWLQVPRTAMLDNSEGGLVRLVFVAFERLEEILQPLDFLSDEGDAEGRRNSTRVVNSKVISASLGKGRHIQFPGSVRIGLKHIRTENVTNPSCVFWDFTTSGWSEEGCEVESTNRTHTICRCNHLTNFAVLMDVHATYLAPSHQMALQIITYIGCIISIVCLVLAIITFQLFRGLKSDRTTIHKNLCMCLLLAEILFLFGISQTDKRLVCGIVAGLLHFFFLCAFAWMFLEGFQLYVMLIEVFEAEKSRMRWYYTFAYGVPFVIVAVSCVVDPFSYGTERYCWLRADNFFIFSFVGPVIAVILANLVFLSMAIYMMCRHSNASVSMKSKEHSRLASASAWLRGAIVLVFLLGLTWTFGLLYLNEESVVMAYIFTILNSLQGLFIFLFHCLQNDKVRKEYRKWNSWLPKCVKCRKYQSSSGTSSKERRSSVFGASHGTGSASNTHSSGMGDQTNASLPNGNSSKIYFKSHNNDIGVGVGGDLRSNYMHGHGHHGHHGSHAGTLQHDVTMASLHSVSLNLHGPDASDRAATLRSFHGDVDIRRQQYRHGPDRVLICELERQPHGSRAATLQVARRRKDHYGEDGVRRADGEDPVYEEIRQANSDASDEELRRGVASRQSLRSYGDHSPLIPSPHAPMDTSRPLGPHSYVVPDPHGFLYSPRSHVLSLDR